MRSEIATVQGDPLSQEGVVMFRLGALLIEHSECGRRSNLRDMMIRLNNPD